MCKINDTNCSHERSDLWDAKIANSKRIKHLKIYFDRSTISWYENAMLGVNTCNFFPQDFSAMLKEPENKILVGESSKLQTYRRRISKQNMELTDLGKKKHPSRVRLRYAGTINCRSLHRISCNSKYRLIGWFAL